MTRSDTLDSAFEIALPKEFRFDACKDYLSRSSIECLYEVQADRIVRLLRAGGGNVLIEIRCSDDRKLRIRALQGRLLGEKAKEEVSAYIRDWFDLDRDLDPFYRMAEGHPLLSDLTKSFYGLRLVGIPDLFEALCWAILGQQVNLTFAYKLKQRVTEAYGESLDYDGRSYRLFPLPERLAAAALSELCELQLTRTKASAIIEVADLMTRGELSRERLLALGSFEAAERELVRVRGVGPWTAHYVRMRCLRDPRAFPVGDVGLQNAVKARLAMDRKPTLKELEALFTDWAGWEAYATFYLWRSLS